ncbi:carcinine hydrolase/isopenicillin-N N-acyltransferase family protein [Nisaea sp.]|uniref:carcinine hydrolase/isopenicillin-N N-acyltransferase family protein n=1 Tax=Nisaea sp. TaxID=2024842 RepID=UPI0032EB02EC
MEKLFRAVDEPQPGPFIRQAVEEGRGFVVDWYAKAECIPDPEECRRRVGTHMPEMLGLFDRMAGCAGDDPAMIAALAGIDPPPFIPAGCSVRAFTRPRPTMLRNYDFHPDATSAVILRTEWSGRHVLGMSEGGSGLLDGVNDAGVAAALTFGGRHVYGAGFSIVQIIRYLLQVASDVKEAADVLRRIALCLGAECTGTGQVRKVGLSRACAGPVAARFRRKCRYEPSGGCGAVPGFRPAVRCGLCVGGGCGSSARGVC